MTQFLIKSEKSLKTFPISDIIGTNFSRETPNFQRFKYHKTKKNNSFSIIMIARTIDLESKRIEDLKEFASALEYMLSVLKY